MSSSASIDADELERFSSRTQDWWDPEGEWRPLHKINPARLEYIREAVCDHLKRDAAGASPFKNLSVLDIGCGGGLTCEPLTRWGAEVTGLDASEKALTAARAHAAQEKLKIDYVLGSVEAFWGEKHKFDVVLALEILEHVADIDSFLKSAGALLKPNGLILFSTVNRTTKSFLLGIVVAEYVLGWVPSGMHDWNKFLRPSELAAHLEKAGLALSGLMGMVYSPITDAFTLREGMVDVNYLAVALKRLA